MGFRDEFVSDLPPDPTDALIVLADRAQNWIQSPPDEAEDPVNTAYVRAIFNRFISRYAPDIDVKSNPPGSEPSVSEYITAVIRYAGARVVDKLLDEYDEQRGEGFGVAELTPDEKTAIHAKLDDMRRTINASLLAPRKKNALMRKINALADEVDKVGTRTDGFFAFAGDAAFVVGEMAEKAKPFIEQVKDILGILRGSRARTEGVALPKSEEPLGLPSPDANEAVDEGGAPRKPELAQRR